MVALSVWCGVKWVGVGWGAVGLCGLLVWPGVVFFLQGRLFCVDVGKVPVLDLWRRGREMEVGERFEGQVSLGLLVFLFFVGGCCYLVLCVAVFRCELDVHMCILVCKHRYLYNSYP